MQEKKFGREKVGSGESEITEIHSALHTFSSSPVTRYKVYRLPEKVKENNFVRRAAVKAFFQPVGSFDTPVVIYYGKPVFAFDIV